MFKVINDKDQPWYNNGLRFKCTGCGQCCTGAPGYVWVTEKEISELAKFFNLSYEDFYKKYTRRVDDRTSLIENQKNYDCIFLKDKKCMVYSVRPVQCKTFPWWPRLLESREEWEEAAKRCEGISIDAPVVELDEIEKQLHLMKEE